LPCINARLGINGLNQEPGWNAMSNIFIRKFSI
jgi:hypothetical protein